MQKKLGFPISKASTNLDCCTVPFRQLRSHYLCSFLGFNLEVRSFTNLKLTATFTNEDSVKNLYRNLTMLG
ncbi:hypothetical protein GLYMA_01G094600v4 [Glycine max]|uniref:Uncharacterized protein n=2 Tax=Glycine subgen. Soja TaxID=1462606 RepID=K7K2D9_SOYBN|nr:hypothetical protein JHK87_001095 [Glycine soja]KAG5068742.1 hypothetical protein JHK85_001119 [Glycine max]KAG5088474.1 hypothetical protein JHK86_001086 [Glycine max]KAH1162348.1 hypothetical protein GYH30_001016 [Glycine max]KRH75583.1 hypothetical protein GLYMA_01G094600v4 [Glycine max]